jgi:PIN domain nuclease of toxin-antitoxin system
MRFLIDTHCWLWMYSASEKLNDAAKALMHGSENTAFFSAVSAAEIGIKSGIGKLRLPQPAKEYVVSRIEHSGMKTIPLHIHHALRVAELPQHHRDPFDRLLIAQAQAEGLPLMTADSTIAKYDVEIIWAGREEPPPRPVQ